MLGATREERVTVPPTPVDVVNGLTLTLRGKPSETISSATAREFLAPLPYYYSPHAGKVFATQPGRVTVTWVSNLPDTSAGGESAATYKFKTEVFSVTSSPNGLPSTSSPSRRI